MPLTCMTPADDNASRSTRLDQCIRLTAENDARAFERLYRETTPAVYAYALSVLKNRQDAEDVLHDCYVNVYHAARGYRSQGRPMGWIMSIAKNLCFQTLRQRSRTEELSQEDWERLPARPGLSEADRLMVRACLSALRDDEQKVLLLHAVAGFKHREIADFLELPLSTVISKYNRAAKKLKSILEKESV